ncbi:MAG: T9SS type A sorting domain-containing protein [Saprospiraceae bacterium]
MKKCNILILCIYFSIIISSKANTPCTPPSADNCEDANVLCSLDEVNGYTCSNPDYSNPTGCTPLCPNGGVTHLTSWWAFVTNGGNICITITFSNCSVNGTGVQLGVWGDCDCVESIFCDPSCTGPGTKMACGTLEPCKTYYLFVDGCNGDVCNFTLTTSGGGPPILPPLLNIIGPTKLCKGACNVIYMARVGGSSYCKPAYQWTLDGHEYDQYSDTIKLDFPNEGNFVLCVTAIIGNPKSGSICDQEGPKCITINVKKDQVLVGRGEQRTLCRDKLPYNWHGLLIDSVGEYKVRLKSICCEMDSIIKFIIEEKKDIGIAYYLGCPNDTFIDPITGQKVFSCQDAIEIQLPSSSNPSKCDSSYNLYAAFFNASARLREYCDTGTLILEALPIDKTCNINGYSTVGFEYKWYKKSDPNKISLGNDDFMVVPKNDEYCLDLSIQGKLNNLTKKCVFTVCEKYDELDFLPKKVCIIGDLSIISGRKGTYMLDSLPRDLIYGSEWTVKHGTILTPNQGKDSTHIEVQWDTTIEKRIICYRYKTACGWSDSCCHEVNLITETINSFDLNDIYIVPNPVSQSFRLSSNSKLKLETLELYNLSGSLVYTWKSIKNNEFLVGQIAEGSYYLKINYKGGSITKKMMINH